MKYIEDNALEAQEHFQKLLMYVQNNRDKDSHYMEKEIFQRLLAIGNSLMKLYISTVGTGDVGKKIELRDGNKLKHIGERSIIHNTIFGEIPISREYYHKACIGSAFPLDNQLNLPERSYSYLLERFTMGVAINDSYDESRRYMHELFGIDLPQSSIQQISRKSSTYFEKYYKEKEVEGIKEGELLVVSADGKGIHIKGEEKIEGRKRLGRGEKNGKKKMALVGTVYNVSPQYGFEERDFKSKDKKIWAFLEDKERTMGLLRDDVNSRIEGTNFNKDILFLADGERGLWNLKEKYFPEAVGILDWYHMSEYLWKAVYVFYPEGSQESKDWIKEMEKKMFEGRVSDVVKGIQVRITKNKIKGNKLNTLRKVIEYFKNNKERMKYNEYISKGYPIGSGNVESACRYLIKDRMERTGMRWKFKGAQAILSLRAIYINNDLNDYWDYYMKNENYRLYNNLTKVA
jgi:hypothetical protein